MTAPGRVPSGGLQASVLRRELSTARRTPRPAPSLDERSGQAQPVELLRIVVDPTHVGGLVTIHNDELAILATIVTISPPPPLPGAAAVTRQIVQAPGGNAGETGGPC